MKFAMKLTPIPVCLLTALVAPVHAQYSNTYVLIDSNTGNTATVNTLFGDIGQNNIAIGVFTLQNLQNNDAVGNTAVGTAAGQAIVNGSYNAAFGNGALHGGVVTTYASQSHNTAIGNVAMTNDATGLGTASWNVAVGDSALYNNGANYNVAVGYEAGYSLTTGSPNSAVGTQALYASTTGQYNTAIGNYAMLSNTNGWGNSVLGDHALSAGTAGSYNTAVGASALNANSNTGNTAVGYKALYSSTGEYNTATGTGALDTNTSGNDNAAFGVNALVSSTTGSDNIAIGYSAGKNLTTGSNDIYIGNPGGGATEGGTIRIGTRGTHTLAFLQGVYTHTLTAYSPVQVYVNSYGELGVAASSERFKTDIASMGEATAKIEELRPVTFRYKDDASGRVQYGLIAEEVAKVYPELVARGEDGTINGVHYEELAPMLLNEVQRQHQYIVAQTREAAEQKEHALEQDARIAGQAKELAELRQQLAEVQELKQQLAVLQGLVTEGRMAQTNLNTGSGL